MTISSQLDSILATRAAHLIEIDAAIDKWTKRGIALKEVIAKAEAAERVNRDVHGASALLRSAAESVRSILADYASIRVRFARETLCIGIGGAAGMGKSTFLQSATGLTEDQIPTGDLFCTTAVRSLIENSVTENTAIADFHSPESFVSDVIAPLCNELGIQAPTSLVAFRNARLELPPSVESSQKNADILKRLRDAQSCTDRYERYLTGKRGVAIPLADLRQFVAYPEDGKTKAGPFLAIANLVVKVPFPATDFARLRMVDLPGIGEAGINLAKAQTDSLRNSCDITILVKKAAAGRVEWLEADTTALDAMRGVVPHVEDQTKFTLVLINGDKDNPSRTRSCEENFRAKVERNFTTVECDAREKDIVTKETMPRILDFLAKNLPEIDEAILSRQNAQAEVALANARKAIEAARAKVPAIGMDAVNPNVFAAQLHDETQDILEKQRDSAAAKTRGEDKEWNDAVTSIKEQVLRWGAEGYGYGSPEELRQTVKRAIAKEHGRPQRFINDFRVKFRDQWEAMDLHLTDRIAQLLSDVMDSLRANQYLNGFVPPKNAPTEDNPSARLAAVRTQIVALADRIDERTKYPGDAEILRELSAPLRRIAEFDLQFRFHLEPLLHAATDSLESKRFPDVSEFDPNAVEETLAALDAKLKEAAEAYSTAMRKTGTGNSAALERKKRLFEKAIPDPSVRADVIALLEQSMSSAQSFCPNRIFAAVVETFFDAFIRSKNSDEAFRIIVANWQRELTPAPDEKTRLTNAAAGAIAALVKAF